MKTLKMTKKRKRMKKMRMKKTTTMSAKRMGHEKKTSAQANAKTKANIRKQMLRKKKTRNEMTKMTMRGRMTANTKMKGKGTKRNVREQELERQQLEFGEQLRQRGKRKTRMVTTMNEQQQTHRHY